MKIRVQDRFGNENEWGAQLGLPFGGKTIDVDGIEDPKYQGQIRYIGKANHVFDNIYRCLAQVGGALCVVEIVVTPVAPSSDPG